MATKLPAKKIATKPAVRKTVVKAAPVQPRETAEETPLREEGADLEDGFDGPAPQPETQIAPSLATVDDDTVVNDDPSSDLAAFDSLPELTDETPAAAPAPAPAAAKPAPVKAAPAPKTAAPAPAASAKEIVEKGVVAQVAEHVSKTASPVHLIAQGTTVRVTRHFPTGAPSDKIETIDVRQFSSPPASVGLKFGATIKMDPNGFDFGKVDVFVTVPCYVEEMPEAYEFIRKFAEERIAKETADLTGGGAEPAPTSSPAAKLAAAGTTALEPAFEEPDPISNEVIPEEAADDNGLDGFSLDDLPDME